MIFKFKNKLKQESGFTLVELLLVLLLMILVVSTITLTYFTSINATNLVVSTTTSEIDSRTALYILKREVREASEISQATQNSIIFTSDINSDDVTEQVSYSLVSEDIYYKLVKSINSGEGKVILSNIVNTDFFNYYSGVGEPIEFPIAIEQMGDIKIIEINMSVDQSGQSSNRTMNLSTKLTLRNNI